METTSKSYINSASMFTPSGLSSTSNGLLEAIWEMMFAVAIATAICVGLANLSVHINDVRAARTGTSGQQEVNPGARLPSGFTPVASQSASGSDGAASSQRPDRT
jgi:hypothetical protein